MNYRYNKTCAGLSLALLIAACSAAASDQASPWDGGADLRLRHIYFDNAIHLNSENPGHDREFQRYRARAWASYKPNDDFKASARLMWAGRHYNDHDSIDPWYSGGILFDRLNLKFDNLADAPVSLTAGRQDMIFGNGWLVLDGTPLDGSRTIYFDALNATYESAQLNTDFNLIYIDQSARTDRFPKSLNDEVEDQIEQDEKGLILYARNKSLQKTKLDGFFIFKRNRPVGDILRNNNGAPFPSPSDDGEVYALGGRVDSAVNPNIQVRAEAALEWGNRNDDDLRAFGLNSRLTYNLKDTRSNALHLGYEYLSGDDPDSERNKAFDPLWGRWPQWSELYIYTYAIETRIGEATNLHRLNLGWAMKPHATTKISLDYHALFADENTRRGATGFSDDDKFRGHLLTAWVRSKFNQHVAGHLVAEYLNPGDYYEDPRTDEAWFFRAELTLTL